MKAETKEMHLHVTTEWWQ